MLRYFQYTATCKTRLTAKFLRISMFVQFFKMSHSVSPKSLEGHVYHSSFVNMGEWSLKLKQTKVSCENPTLFRASDKLYFEG